MGKVTRPAPPAPPPETMAAMLRRLNPRARDAEISIYLDAHAEYHTAQANIREHGTIVFHPRTGAPIDNPYIRVRDQAATKILRLDLRTDAGWVAP